MAIYDGIEGWSVASSTFFVVGEDAGYEKPWGSEHDGSDGE